MSATNAASDITADTYGFLANRESQEGRPESSTQELDDSSRISDSTRLRLKRGFDVVCSLAILLLVAPVFIPIAIAVALDGGPIFFSHRRIGLHNREFPCTKFRTMRVDAESVLAELLRNSPEMRAEWEHSRKLRNDPRVTAVGRFLRATSLDELPQLFNVLRGDMSLVGPRPVVRAELTAYYAPFTLGNSRLGAVGAYLSVRPGITGLWQVSGRSDASYQTRVALDVAYAENLSLRHDLWVLYRTVIVVLRGAGAR